MTETAVRLGFVGAGGRTVRELLDLVQIPGATIAALCDVDEPRCAQAVQRVQERTAAGSPTPAAAERARAMAPAFYPDVQRMLDGTELDAVYVSLPPFAHGAIEHAIVDAGKAIFVEKPVAMTPTEGREILDHIRQKGVISCVGYQSRYSTAVQAAPERPAGRAHRPGDGHPPRRPARHALVAGAVPLRGHAGRAAHPRRRPDALPGRRGRVGHRLRQHGAADRTSPTWTSPTSTPPRCASPAAPWARSSTPAPSSRGRARPRTWPGRCT